MLSEESAAMCLIKMLPVASVSQIIHTYIHTVHSTNQEHMVLTRLEPLNLPKLSSTWGIFRFGPAPTRDKSRKKEMNYSNRKLNINDNKAMEY